MNERSSPLARVLSAGLRGLRSASVRGLQINSGAIDISPERSPKILRYFYYEQVNRSNNALAVLVVLITGTATAIVEIIDADAVGARHGISDPIAVAVVNTIRVVIILRAVGPIFADCCANLVTCSANLTNCSANCSDCSASFPGCYSSSANSATLARPAHF